LIGEEQKTMSRCGSIFILLLGCTLLSSPTVFARSAPPAPQATTVSSQSATEHPQSVVRTNETFLEFLRRTQATTATSPLVSTATVPLLEGVSTTVPATVIPDWLAGPATGTVEGISLPLSLDNCVQLALRHNFGLQSSRRDLEIARSTYRQEVFEFVPFVDVFSGYTYADSKTGLRDGSGLEQTRSHDFSAGLRVQQNFPTGGDLSISQQVDRTRLSEQSRVERVDPVTGRVTDVSHPSTRQSDWTNALEVVARQPLLQGGGLNVGMANLRLARLGQIESRLTDQVRRREMVLSVIRNYFVILQRQLDARVSLDAIREKKRFYDETKDKHELGEVPESEIWRAEIQWLQEQQRSRQLQQAFLDSLDSLLLVMGLPLETSYRLREFTGQMTDLATLGLMDPEACVREALADRFEIALSEIAIRRSRIQVELARNGVLPSLDVEARYSDSEGGTHLRNVRSLNDRRTWSLGALFDLPIPNMARREALRRARLRLEKVEIERKSLDREIAEEVRRLQRALLSNRARVEILANTVALAERSLQLENARFQYGENTSLEVRQAQDDLFQARTDYNNALLRYQSDLASLYRAMGRPLYDQALGPVGEERETP